jgi:hypothetical protein
MMKRAIQAVLIVAMLFVTTSASAQFGVKLGFVATQHKIETTKDSESGTQVGVLAGINYDVPLTGGLSIRPGINYIYVGANVEDERERDHSLALFLFDMKYTFKSSEEKIVYVTAGPKVNVGIAFENNKYGDLYKKGSLSRFDLQLGLGAGMRFGVLSLELGYDIGLLNRVDRYYSTTSSLMRNQLVLSMGYTF